MDREQKLFLTVLGDFLHNRPTVLTETEYNWDVLYHCGKVHSLGGILYHQLRGQLSPEVEALLQGDYLASIVQYRHRLAVTRELTDLLTAHDIDHFLIKGDLIGAYYSVPALRTMSDVDLMIHHEDQERVEALLREAGFRCNDRGISVWVYERENVIFEIHDQMIRSSHREDDTYAAYTRGCWERVRDGRLDANFHFIYLLLHLRKHFRVSGVGFRQFLDLAFTAGRAELDWALLRRELERLGLWRFTQTVFRLCQLWFDAPCPVECLTLSEDFVAQATDNIFENGVFGFSNKENQNNEMVNINRSEGFLGLFLSILTILFPSYEALCEETRFGFIRGKPVLLPFVWIYRIILLIVEGKLKTALSNVSHFGQQVRDRNETYEKWGL